MDLKTEKEVLIEDLNRANKLCEEATLGYMNMCKQVEVLEKCLNEIEILCQNIPTKLLFKNRLEMAKFILGKIKEVKGNE